MTITQAPECLRAAQDALSAVARAETGNTAARLCEALQHITRAEDAVTTVLYEDGAFVR